MVRTIVKVVGIAAIFAATLSLATTSYAKGKGGSGGGSGKGGNGGTGKGGSTGKGHNNHNHHHNNHHNNHHHLHGTGGNWNSPSYGGGDIIDSSSAEEDTMQTVRYLRVRNESGEALKVFVQLEQGGKTFNWNFAPGAAGYLAINGERIASDRVYLWAQSGSKRWTSVQTSGLTLVSQPYQAEEIGTFTYTFNP